MGEKLREVCLQFSDYAGIEGVDVPGQPGAQILALTCLVGTEGEVLSLLVGFLLSRLYVT
jgi:hypothetical protein